jgi:hypothetical protein
MGQAEVGEYVAAALLIAMVVFVAISGLPLSAEAQSGKERHRTF